MKNALFILPIFISSLLISTSIFAHEEGQVSIGEIKPSVREVVASKVADVKTKVAEVKASASAKIQELQERKASGSADLKLRIKEATEDFRLQREAKKEELKLQFKTKREEFKQKLESIKDERKRLVVERLDNNMAAINKKVTDQQVVVLERLSSILDKLSNRALKAQGNGVEVGSVEEAIKVAQTQISNAQGVVATQAGKQYVITIVSDSNLGQAVSSTKQLLMADLKESRSAVAGARSAVEAALKSLASLKGVDDVE
ncbi:MAG: hypothetical protein A3A61_02810 [Candidatus Woykebacteria bacterium RIFCSPLOWO2_01_FULL_43_14]|uniref:DUF5667 domain-containing protein n=2 Tax=Candidatus Woykeibacteriota TaxID=1817899 RepID=A0A1G1WUA1_9BACT|nr:MAG: hypothetical protein A3J50_04315 [Candidatus Woykebacteria bacterium RIFCSPHIGHO2_02_FULL_43_16b]OGY31298.1 MAG: hypothetical protein A3A61_02810 [Candidatus Woykebacteria bacterium RIFCSPLOWO2_01_FULL_43_14]